MAPSDMPPEDLFVRGFDSFSGFSTSILDSNIYFSPQELITKRYWSNQGVQWFYHYGEDDQLLYVEEEVAGNTHWLFGEQQQLEISPIRFDVVQRIGTRLDRQVQLTNRGEFPLRIEIGTTSQQLFIPISKAEVPAGSSQNIPFSFFSLPQV